MQLNRPRRPGRSPLALRADDGFTLLITLGVMLVSSLLLAVAFSAAGGDARLTGTDNAAKKAYYAAQAGIDDYTFHLNRDINYWTYCTSGLAATNKALNQEGSTTNKVAVPGSTDEKYAIQLLTASTSPEKKCNPSKPEATMIEAGSEAGGTFRIQSTGYSGNQVRTLVATYANAGFLNYIYYTKYETADPNTYTPAKPQCEAFRAVRPSECENINFFGADEIKGPLHTEDTAQVCGEPTFGRGPQDLIEFRGWWVGNSTCSGNGLEVKGTLVPQKNVVSLEPPPSNLSLSSIAGTTYSGKTSIVLTGETMTVTNKGSTTTNVAFPSNGVIFVSNSSCSVTTYTPYNPSYTADSGCGNVYVKGNYTKSLTIAAENDVVINGNVTTPTEEEEPSTGAVLGLIANNFVRIYHPLNGNRGNSSGECGNSSNSSEDLTNPKIYAALLAVRHSVILDNFDCGASLGSLNIYGAIAQIFRGFVSVGSGNSITHGYAKNYNYDDRFQVESPPSFLNPVKAPWRVRRETLAPNP
jgi:Tfp pilus assembly protein PilX